MWEAGEGWDVGSGNVTVYVTVVEILLFPQCIDIQKVILHNIARRQLAGEDGNEINLS